MSSGSPGSQLRVSREARTESINEVAFALKLHPRQVTALEEDDFQALPGEAFVRGFMRNYARYLGLDAVPLLAAVAEMGGGRGVDLSPVGNAEGELPNGDGTRRTLLPVGGLIAMLVLMLAAAWYFDWFRTESAALIVTEEGSETEPAFARPQIEVIEPAGRASEAGAGFAGDRVTGERQVEEQQTDAEQDEDAALAPATLATGAEASTAPTAAASALDRAEEDASSTLAGTPAAAETSEAAERARLQFHFSAESWVEVRDGKGSIVHSGVNQAGSSRKISGEPPFALTIGNAASVRAEFDGAPLDLLAHTKGSVARLTVK